MRVTVKKMIEDYLKRNGHDGNHNGYDGLFNVDDDGCACELKDLNRHECITFNCRAGYKKPCDCEEDHEFHIGL